VPSIDENRTYWGDYYDWSRGGEEWSDYWGGPELEWYGSVLPRVHQLVPANTILELAPGFGRWTSYLKDLCSSIILVDLSEKCIDACRERFASLDHVSYHVNDGCSLDFIADDSIDLVFSFDSFVHVEADTMKAYLEQLARKLKKDGAGFIHHSNLGEYRRLNELVVEHPEVREQLLSAGLDANAHWRAPTMSAQLFKELAEQSGLRCMTQEMISWGDSEASKKNLLIDCFSTFSRSDSTRFQDTPYRAVRNEAFVKECAAWKSLAALYGRGAHPERAPEKRP
jgi:ubiquinone/menaquinone biosynthesis C-methylase UbiE